MGSIDIAVGIGLICTVAGFLVSYLVYGRNKAKDDKAEGASIATITSDMGYIKSSVDGINKKLEMQDQRHIDVITRLCNVETSAKSAHKRIDDIVDKEK